MCTGVDDLFTPEVAAVQPSTDFELVFGNDMLKVQAVINNIQGRDSNNTRERPSPFRFPPPLDFSN